MSLDGKPETQDRLILDSRLSEIARVAEWVDVLAARHYMSANIQLSINLCLEETLANVIRHGYADEPGHELTIDFAIPRPSFFLFTVEDRAPHFNPLEAPEKTALRPDEEFRVGGQGIRFLRRFADLLEYDALPSGNRMRMGFREVQTAATAE
jgi:anti-sigma regulatory factor (Ser/Thr protein kinase)